METSRKSILLEKKPVKNRLSTKIYSALSPSNTIFHNKSFFHKTFDTTLTSVRVLNIILKSKT